MGWLPRFARSDGAIVTLESSGKSDSFAARLLLAMKTLNFSRGQLSAAVGVDKSLVSRWLSGQVMPNSHNRARISEALSKIKPGFNMTLWDRPRAEFDHFLGIADFAPAQVNGSAEVRDVSAARDGDENGPGNAVSAFFSRTFRHASWTSRRYATVAVIGLLVAGGAYWWSRPSDMRVAQGPHLDRVAVLPFDTLSTEQDVRFFGDAVAEQMIGVLNDNQVQTVSRDDSAALRGAGRDEALRKLGAEFILDGTVQRTAAGLRVTAHIEHASTHVTLWTESFDQAGEDSLALQAQVAAKAVDKIKVALEARGPSAGEIDDATLAAYLSARDNVREIGDASYMHARDLFKEIVARAPKFSLGHSGLAVALVSSPSGEDAVLRSAARKEAARALELDPSNGQAYIALFMMMPARHWTEQEAILRRGLAAAADQSSLYRILAQVLADTGRLAEAASANERSVMLDPLSAPKNAASARSLAGAGRVAEANAVIDRAYRLWPTNSWEWWMRLDILTNYGREAEARAMLDAPERAPGPLEPEFVAALRAYLDALVSKKPAAKALAKRAVLAARASGRLDVFGTITMLARLGEIDAAFDQTKAAYATQARSELYTAFLFEPPTTQMRADPRFRGLMEQVGLLAYWKTTHIRPDFCATENVSVCLELQRS